MVYTRMIDQENDVQKKHTLFLITYKSKYSLWS